jgi:hypothetical protein
LHGCLTRFVRNVPPVFRRARTVYSRALEQRLDRARDERAPHRLARARAFGIDAAQHRVGRAFGAAQQDALVSGRRRVRHALDRAHARDDGARLVDGRPALARHGDVRRPAQNLVAQLVPKAVRQRQRHDQRRHPARDPDERRARRPLHDAPPPPHPQIPQREKEFERHIESREP